MHRLLEQNETIILFLQGLVFFCLGFAVWIQRRRATRLRLTQSLIWLAAFAFAEALAVWGTVFVPIQEGWFDSGVIDVLIVIRALLQTGAFVLLTVFALRLLTRSRTVMVSGVAIAVALWIGLITATAIVAHGLGWDFGQWERSLEALARHLILLPASLMTAVALVRQGDELAEAGLTGVRPTARFMAAAFVAHAVFAGILVDRPFWAPGPAALDADRFTAFGIELSLVRATIGLVIAILAVAILEVFEAEAKQQLEELDRARAVAEERARFGRDLHDGTIQSLYAAGLHLEAVARTSVEATTRRGVRTVIDGLNETIGGIRTYISDLQSGEGSPQIIAADLREMVREFNASPGYSVHFRASGMATAGILPDETRQHLGHILREAVSNATRHGGARTVTVHLSFSPDELDLTVVDDGTGIPEEVEQAGQGLRNMRERARRLGGRTVIERDDSGGTRVAVAIPLDSEDMDELETESEVTS